jgi:flavin reductase
MKKYPGEDMAIPKNGRMEIGAVPGQNLDPARFRVAMSRVAAAVHIVTTNGPAGLAGITATSVASITDEPPMMLFCINKTSPSAAKMIANGVFCINTLAPSHEAIADIFAGRTGHHLADRFAGGEWTKLVTGAPVLRRAAAAFDCRLVEAKSVMTHFVMIGAVEAATSAMPIANTEQCEAGRNGHLFSFFSCLTSFFSRPFSCQAASLEPSLRLVFSRRPSSLAPSF